MRIAITGPRSVGKSTISKIVAEKLNLKYISSDDL
jgi:cytidylate kinase